MLPQVADGTSVALGQAPLPVSLLFLVGLTYVVLITALVALVMWNLRKDQQQLPPPSSWRPWL